MPVLIIGIFFVFVIVSNFGLRASSFQLICIGKTMAQGKNPAPCALCRAP
jgi:hypothetical protein